MHSDTTLTCWCDKNTKLRFIQRKVFATRGAATFTQRAFVKVLIAGWSNVSCRAGTEVVSANRVGVTVGAFLTWIADAGVIQLAQQPWKTIKKIMSLQNAGCDFVQLMTN